MDLPKVLISQADIDFEVLIGVILDELRSFSGAGRPGIVFDPNGEFRFLREVKRSHREGDAGELLRPLHLDLHAT